MTQTKSSNRIVVIAGNVPEYGNAGYREPTHPQATTHRIVVIKYGELVGSRSGR